METHRQLILALLLVALTPHLALAYAISTHQGLTEQTVRAYEKWQGDAFDPAATEAILRGSAEEDDGARPLNHFFDPVHNRGLTEVKELGLPSPRWALDTEVQGNFCIGLCLGTTIGRDDTYFSSPTDFSWDRAIFEYVHGDQARALATLGHLLHLVQDKTTPAHVRNDQHLFGDPYESFAGKYGVGSTPSPAAITIPRHASLTTYLEDIAKRVNAKFVSKDTLFRRYDLPSLNDLEIKDGFAIDPEDGHFVAVAISAIDRFGNTQITDVRFDNSDNVVASNNFTHLSRLAIENGVGVIDLFFRAVEQEKSNGTLLAKNTSANERTARSLASGGFTAVKRLYGSSLTQADVDELAGTQSAAALLALAEERSVPLTLAEEAPVVVALDEPPRAPPSAPATPAPPTPATPPSTPTLPTPAHAPESGVFHLFAIEPGYGGGGGSATPAPAPGDVPSAAPLTAPEPETPTPAFNESTEPPTLTVPACAASLSSTNCLVATTTVALSWTHPDGAASYTLYRDDTSVLDTTDTSASLALTPNTTASIAVVAHDAYGATSTSTTVSIRATPAPLRITEIGWAGTPARSSDTWVEIKNISSETLSLAHVSLVSNGTVSVPLTGTLAPNSFLIVMAREGALTYSLYPFTSLVSALPLPETGTQLSLVWNDPDGTTLLDQSPAAATCASWCAGGKDAAVATSFAYGTTTAPLSMERDPAATDGTLASSWRSNDGYTRAGFDADGTSLYASAGLDASLGHPSFGWFCSPDTRSIARDASYTPPSSACTYLSRFLDSRVNRYVGLYRGEVGSSTELKLHFAGRAISREEAWDTIPSPLPGEPFFVAFFELRTGPAFDGDLSGFTSFLTTGTAAPHPYYATLPWVYGE